MRAMRLLLLAAFLLPVSEPALAADPYTQIPREDVSAGERAMNFGAVYFAQWASYYATQESIIKEHGSWDNWKGNATKPHFDKDHLNFNLSKHTLVGHYYYLFYRSRGYTRQDAFEWAFLSSLAFEFTIETYTERPSYQDIYQTPVFGSVVGMGVERLSLYFHSLETWPTTMLGVLFNPFSILPFSHYRLGWQPTRHEGKNAFAVTWEAEL